MVKNIWVIGCGDIGRRLAKLYSPSININGVVQSESSIKVCSESNILPLQIDLDLLSSKDLLPKLKQLNNAELYYFAPPPSSGDKDTRLNNFLNTLASSNVFPSRIVLISTTGVYGDSQGEWIDETTPVHPVADRAKRRLNAEKALLNWSKTYGVTNVILRVPGIYASDRLPLTRLKKELPIVDESEAGYTNRIHADDLAMICKTAMESTISDEIINACDGNPSTMTSYFNHVADYANLPRPPQVSMEKAEEILSEGMISYLRESRRINNDKLINMLKVKLKYPSLSSALPL